MALNFMKGAPLRQAWIISLTGARRDSIKFQQILTSHWRNRRSNNRIMIQNQKSQKSSNDSYFRRRSQSQRLCLGLYSSRSDLNRPVWPNNCLEQETFFFAGRLHKPTDSQTSLLVHVRSQLSLGYYVETHNYRATPLFLNGKRWRLNFFFFF